MTQEMRILAGSHLIRPLTGIVVLKLMTTQLHIQLNMNESVVCCSSLTIRMDFKPSVKKVLLFCYKYLVINSVLTKVFQEKKKIVFPQTKYIQPCFLTKLLGFFCEFFFSNFFLKITLHYNVRIASASKLV